MNKFNIQQLMINKDQYNKFKLKDYKLMDTLLKQLQLSCLQLHKHNNYIMKRQLKDLKVLLIVLVLDNNIHAHNVEQTLNQITNVLVIQIDQFVHHVFLLKLSNKCMKEQKKMLNMIQNNQSIMLNKVNQKNNYLDKLNNLQQKQKKKKVFLMNCH